MGYGETYFSMLASGSTATSAATAHLLFGIYGGLSLLNQNDVVNVQLQPTVADVRLWNSTVTNNTGLRLGTAGSAYDLPPMRVGEASGLHIARDTTTNTTVLWTIWNRWGGVNK